MISMFWNNVIHIEEMYVSMLMNNAIEVFVI